MEECRRGTDRGEPGAPKKRLRLGETRRTPAAVKAEVLALVQRTRERNDWPVARILRALGLARTVFYAWQARAAADALADRSPRAPRTAQLLPEERAASVRYAEAHPGEGYRRLAWQMVDAEVVAASPSAVYDVLQAAGRLYRPAPDPGSGRKPPPVTRPDQRWHVDVLYLWVLGRWYFLVTVIDAYSRYIVQWELCWTLTGDAMALVLQAALDRTPGATPEVVSDNGPEFINRDFVTVLKAQGLKQIRTRFYHPESNGVLERYHRTFREEGWGQAQPAAYPAAQALIAQWVHTYNRTWGGDVGNLLNLFLKTCSPGRWGLHGRIWAYPDGAGYGSLRWPVAGEGFLMGCLVGLCRARLPC